MSNACNNLLLHSPSSKHSSSLETDVFNKFIHIDSPRRSTATPFKRPSSRSKWKAVLAHLTPPRLLPVCPAALRSSTRSRPPAPASASHLTDYSVSASHLITDCSVDSLHATDCTVPVPVAVAPIQVAPLDIQLVDDADRNLQLQLVASNRANEMQHLLQNLTESSHPNTHIDDRIAMRSRALASLCSLCVASPSIADCCVAGGGVDIILNILNCIPNDVLSGLGAPTSAVAMVVEESERALLLLQLLTSSSADGCGAALRHSSLIIAMLGKKLLRVSDACTASAIGILTTLCQHPEAAPFCKAVSETAIPSKLVVVLQVASKHSTKRRAGRLLRLLGEQQQSESESQL